MQGCQKQALSAVTFKSVWVAKIALFLKAAIGFFKSLVKIGAGIAPNIVSRFLEKAFFL